MNRLFVAIWPLVFWACTASADPPRDAESILKDYEGVKEPVVDATKLKDPSYFQSYFSERMKALEKKDAFALELYQAHPEHPQATPLMLKRWGNMAGSNAEKAIPEMEQFLKDHPDSKVRPEVLYQ